MRNLESRVTKVDRQKLLLTLRANRIQHEVDYLEALAGFKEVSKAKVLETAKEVQKMLTANKKKLLKFIAGMTDEEIVKQNSSINFISGRNVVLDIPVSHLKEYDTAIDMFEWEVSDTVELNNTEFSCFIQDKWDWKEDFTRVSNVYKAAKL